MAECEELVESGGAEEDMPRVVAALAGILERVANRNDAAGHLGARLHGAHRAVRWVQPRVLRRGLRLPGPPPAPRPPPGARRRLLQRAPPPHYRRARRRQVHGRHVSPPIPLSPCLCPVGYRDQTNQLSC
jgi:hypothetical protein